MGASNVAMVFTHWAHLEHRDARGLAYMANVAMDQDEPPLYFGGPEALAAALGHNPADKPESARRTAVRVISALTRAGAIVSSGQARPGVRAEYALALNPECTYKPSGTGRNVKWSKVSRDLPEPSRDLRESPQRETATVPPPETPSVLLPETASVAPPETPTVPTWDSQCPKGETATGTPRKELQEQPQEQQEEYKEDQSIVDAFASPTRGGSKESDDTDWGRRWVDPDPVQSMEAERQRQLKALQDRMKAAS